MKTRDNPDWLLSLWGLIPILIFQFIFRVPGSAVKSVSLPSWNSLGLFLCRPEVAVALNTVSGWINVTAENFLMTLTKKLYLSIQYWDRYWFSVSVHPFYLSYTIPTTACNLICNVYLIPHDMLSFSLSNPHSVNGSYIVPILALFKTFPEWWYHDVKWI